jgi:hypothetical protein
MTDPTPPTTADLTTEQREWIDARADELFRQNERQRGGVRPATTTPQDYRDYFVASATAELFRARLKEAEARAERIEAICRALVASYDCDAGVYALGELHRAREAARAAIAAEARGD